MDPLNKQIIIIIIKKKKSICLLSLKRLLCNMTPFESPLSTTIMNYLVCRLRSSFIFRAYSTFEVDSLPDITQCNADYILNNAYDQTEKKRVLMNKNAASVTVYAFSYMLPRIRHIYRIFFPRKQRSKKKKKFSSPSFYLFKVNTPMTP